ncbi:ead/Ea22-like family protein [Escherichia coli]|uniref:ead/Ea22-like family protein n=1 Tax=Escherichia coli TaxID=562 RepID=UPI001D0A94D4|nr:ead/Ea22-like family protein [Escherichia coli]MCB8775625.1 ead/Ea22-like family protein [Escherichia coli]
MSKIDYQALRGAAEAIKIAATPQKLLAFRMKATPQVVLELLDELEIKSKRINELIKGGENAKYVTEIFRLEKERMTLVAENAVMLETIEAVRSVADNSSGIAGWHLNGDIATWEEILPEINDIETPATDAFLAELRAKAFDDLCAAFVKHASVAGLGDGDSITVREATDALLHCAEQLREGGIK